MSAAVVLAALALCGGAGGRSAAVANGYFRLTAGEGCVRVQFDPAGRGRYGGAGATLRPYRWAVGARAAADGGAMGIAGARCFLPGAGRGGYDGPFDHGEDLRPGGSLGQSFTVSAGGGWLCDVWALLTCSGVADSAVTMTLRRDGPTGEVVARRRVRPLPNDSEVHLTLERPAAPGVFYLEVAEKRGGAYWWGCNTDVLSGGSAFVDGRPQPGRDWRLGYSLADTSVTDWRVRPAGSRLVIEGVVRERTGSGAPPALALELPWRREGYDTRDARRTPFRCAFTDGGHWFPVEAFKRLEQDWSLEPACAWVRLCGGAGGDLRVMHCRGSFQPRMEAERWSVLMGPGGSVEALAAGPDAPAYVPRLFTSDRRVDGPLNAFLRTYLTSHSSCPSGYEWDALKLAWVGGPIHDSFQRVILHFTHRIDPDGFIWSRGESRGWDGGDCSRFDSRHYDGNGPFILACWRWYCWTGDRAFLRQVAPTVRRATDYLLEAMHGREGILTIDSPQHAGVRVGETVPWPSSYWDCIPAGWRDAYVNLWFAPALGASAELERAAAETEAGGSAERAAMLEGLAAPVRTRFNREFWDGSRGRYIGWIDVKGGRHDPGMTYVNTMAASYGLARPEQVRGMFRWMTEEPTASGKRDTFTRWGFAPRSNTEHCVEQNNRLAWDEWCEDGGAILWTAYYEVMARALHLGAEDGWRAFLRVLARFGQSDRLCGGNPMLGGAVNNHGGPPGSIGVWGEFPESGAAPCAFVYAFVGVSADRWSLRIRPRLPAGLQFAGVDGLVYRGVRLRVTVRRGRVEVAWTGGRRTLRVGRGGEVRVTPAMLGR